MDFMTFYKQIKGGVLNPVVLITGVETYLIDNLTKFIIDNFLSPEFKDFNLTVLENNVDMDELLSIASTMPLFDARRIVVISNTGLLKQIKDDQEAKLISLLSEVQPHLVLLFVESELDKRKKVYKQLSKIGDVVTVDKLTHSEFIKWVSKRFKSYKIEIDNHALNYFVEMVNYFEVESNKNLYDVDNLIRSIGSREEKITEKIIDQYIEVPVEHNIFKMMDAISTNEMSEAIKILNHFIVSGEPEIKIFFMISQQFRNIFKTKILLDAGHSSATIASKLEIHPFVAKKAGSFSTRFSNVQLNKIMDILEEVDINMKSSGLQAQLLIEKALFQISNVKK